MDILKVTFILTSGKTVVLTLPNDFDAERIIKAVQEKQVLQLETQYEHVVIKCDSVIAVLIRRMKFDQQKGYYNDVNEDE